MEASDTTVPTTVPSLGLDHPWEIVIDTSGEHSGEGPFEAGGTFPLEPRSLVVMRAYAETPAEPDHSVAASVASLTTPIPIIKRPDPTQ